MKKRRVIMPVLFLILLGHFKFSNVNLMAQQTENKGGDELVIEDASGNKVADDETSEKSKKQEETYLIEVTAQKRKQNIQNVPASVTGLNTRQVEDAGIDSTNDVYSYVPNMTSSSFGHGFTYYSIRGQSNVNNYGPAVGIYIDDVPLLGSSNTNTAQLYEIERIEILRGPQGNLYGNNSTGGVINIITKKPDNFWTGKASGTYGNYNAYSFTGAVSGPVVKDKLYMGFAGTYRAMDSYIEEENADTHKTTILDGRFQVRTTPIKNLDIALTANLGKSQMDFNPWTPIDDNPFKDTYKNFDEKMDARSDSESLRASYHTRWFDITSVTSRTYNEDGGKSYMTAYMMAMYWHEKVTNWTQEIRLNSSDEKSPLQWLTGLFYHNKKLIGKFSRDFGGGMMDNSHNNLDSNIVSVYGQISYTFIKRLTLTAGCRYDFKTSKLDYHHDMSGMVMSDYHNESKEWHGWAPKASIDYRAHESVLVYLSAAKGYKAGGFAVTQADDPDASALDPENAWSFEGGLKTNWWNNRIIANIAGYFTLVNDVQMFYYDGSTGSYIFSNSGEAHVGGIDFELVARPVKGLELMGSFGYIFAEFANDTLNGEKGNKLPFAPMFQTTVATQYTMPWGVFARIEVNWNDKIYFNEANDQSENGFTLLNFKVGYKREHINVFFYMNNALNTEYYTYKIEGQGQIAAPRTFGAQATLEF